MLDTRIPLPWERRARLEVQEEGESRLRIRTTHLGGPRPTLFVLLGLPLVALMAHAVVTLHDHHQLDCDDDAGACTLTRGFDVLRFPDSYLDDVESRESYWGQPTLYWAQMAQIRDRRSVIDLTARRATPADRDEALRVIRAYQTSHRHGMHFEDFSLWRTLGVETLLVLLGLAIVGVILRSLLFDEPRAITVIADRARSALTVDDVRHAWARVRSVVAVARAGRRVVVASGDGFRAELTLAIGFAEANRVVAWMAARIEQTPAGPFR